MKYGPEHKARTREALLQEGAAEIRAKGIGGVSVAALMGRLNLTHGGFYAYFKSKGALVAEAIDTMFDDRYAVFFADVESTDPDTALRRFVTSYLSERHRCGIAHGCPIPPLAGALADMDEEVRARFSAATRRLTSALARLLERKGHRNPRAAAATALAEMAGAVSLARIEVDEEQASHILTDACASVLAKMDLA